MQVKIIPNKKIIAFFTFTLIDPFLFEIYFKLKIFSSKNYKLKDRSILVAYWICKALEKIISIVVKTW